MPKATLKSRQAFFFLIHIYFNILPAAAAASAVAVDHLIYVFLTNLKC